MAQLERKRNGKKKKPSNKLKVWGMMPRTASYLPTEGRVDPAVSRFLDSVFWLFESGGYHTLSRCDRKR